MNSGSPWRERVLLTRERARRVRSGLRADDTHALIKAAFAASSHEGFRVIEFSVQSNHLHMVAESSDEGALARGMMGLTTRIARGLNKLWRRAGKVFPDRYHARILETPRAVRTALIYVLQNARKHGAWRALVPDAYSSGVWFEGWKGDCRSNKVAESSPPILQRARTWLLTIGWRRYGLIDPLQAPVTV